jgi:hypothetical protein
MVMFCIFTIYLERIVRFDCTVSVMVEGRSALHDACSGDDFETATSLITRGADVNAEDANGDRPLSVSTSRR